MNTEEEKKKEPTQAPKPKLQQPTNMKRAKREPQVIPWKEKKEFEDWMTLMHTMKKAIPIADGEPCPNCGGSMVIEEEKRACGVLRHGNQFRVGSLEPLPPHATNEATDH